MERMNKWLIEVAARIVLPRVVVALLIALFGVLADAGLLGGELSDALVALLRQYAS